MASAAPAPVGENTPQGPPPAEGAGAGRPGGAGGPQRAPPQELLRVAARGARGEEPRVRPEVFELELQLRGVVALGVERVDLGEDRLEALARVALEAHL